MKPLDNIFSRPGFPGITARVHFAGLAWQALLHGLYAADGSTLPLIEGVAPHLARTAFVLADAFLAESEKGA